VAKSDWTLPHNRREFERLREFYDAVSSGPWVGTLDTGLIYQVTPNFSIDVNAFFGLTRSAPDYNLFSGFGYRF